MHVYEVCPAKKSRRRSNFQRPVIRSGYGMEERGVALRSRLQERRLPSFFFLTLRNSPCTMWPADPLPSCRPLSPLLRSDSLSPKAPTPRPLRLSICRGLPFLYLLRVRSPFG